MVISISRGENEAAPFDVWPAAGAVHKRNFKPRKETPKDEHVHRDLYVGPSCAIYARVSVVSDPLLFAKVCTEEGSGG